MGHRHRSSWQSQGPVAMGRLPRINDEPARTIAVLKIVAREIRRNMCGPMPTPEYVSPSTLAARAEAAGFGGPEPLPPLVEAELKRAEVQSGNPVSQTPDFSPDILLNVKQAASGLGPVIRRDGCADILDVSLDWFDRAAPGLMAAYGFPAPRDATGQKRWDRDAVAAWSLTATATEVLARARAAHAKTKAKAGRGAA